MGTAQARAETGAEPRPFPAQPPPEKVARRRSGLTFLLLLALAAEVGMLVMLLQNRNRPPPAAPVPRAVSALEQAHPAPVVEEAAPPATTETRGSAKSAARPAADLPRPKAAQLRAARRIAEARRAEIRREAAAAAPVVSTPQLAPSGRVVQLGAYSTMQQAEAAADVFRYRYRGLLQSLPQGVIPFRPKNSTKLFYRVQFVTPSQAYSEVTCQRLRAAEKSCIVVY